MIEFLLEHAKKDPVSFHMPGHKGSGIFKKYGFDEALAKMVDMDITEIPGADNLFQAEGIIKDVQDRYAKLYDAKSSYLLINGTSGGLIASILAAVPAGGKLIMARNSHKSVFNALTLGNIEPVYVHPELDRDAGITGPVDPEDISELLNTYPDAEAVILPSPNYYGFCSDIGEIADIVHKTGKILIVDQAHGAHLKFFHKYDQGERNGIIMPPAAEDCGADIVVNSIHKTLASLTQSAVLNLCSDRVDKYKLEDKLQSIESTSPSYILMAFLDINATILEDHGHDAIKNWRDNIEYFYQEAGKIPQVKVMDRSFKNGWGLDRTKINLSLEELGISGAALEKHFMKHDIFPELFTGDLLMLMTGIGNTRDHMNRTLKALSKIASSAKVSNRREIKKDVDIHIPSPGPLHPVPKYKELVSIDDAAGKICAASIIPYPPGIPFVCPGEEITAEVAKYIKSLRDAGEKVMGIDEKNQVLIGK